MNGERMFNVLFVCTRNSARSQMAEAILNHEGKGRFRAFSAGSHPAAEIDPHVLALLERHHLTRGLRPKNWNEFARPGAPEMDFVFTLCDQAAGETCPTWPKQPVTAHWGVPDPVTADGNEAEKALAFAEAYRMLATRIGVFVNLRLDKLDRRSLQGRLDDIGRAP